MQTSIKTPAWLSMPLIVIAFFLVLGCGEDAEPVKKPKVVREKIVVSKDKSAKAPVKVAQESPAASTIKQDAPKSGDTAIAQATPTTQKTPGGQTPTAIPDASAQTVEKAVAADTGSEQVPVLKVPEQKESAIATIAYRYDPKGRIDPFEPLFRQEEKGQKAVKSTSKRKRRIPTTPLEKVDLSQLKLVATLRATSGDRALVEDATGKGFIIKKGTYIGTNSGVVIEIIKDRVVVEEEVETILGEISIQKRELKLQKPPGE